MGFKLLRQYLIFIFIFQVVATRSQTYTGPGGNIPDNGNMIEFTIQVSGLSPSILDTTLFGLESVCVNIHHTWVSDLDIRLIAPDGTSVVLTSGNGGNGHNYSVTCFNSNSTNSIIAGSAPFNGTYRPQGWIGFVNNGQNGNGIWKLRILDTWAWADEGILIDWSLTFGNQPSGVFQLKTSNLPIVVINSNNIPIPDEPKITAHMGIIYNGVGNINSINDPFNAYDGYIGIELRGSSSQLFPKKPYGMETRDEFGNNFNIPLLGMPKENDWVLIANYSDKTLMRNTLTYDLAREMGFWAPRTRFCELIINNEYQGVYALMEKIKRDNDRVNISILTPDSITGDAVTGGYIIKIDKFTGTNNDSWQSSFYPQVHSSGQRIHFQYHYPKASDITNEQKTYIQDYMYAFENALNSPQFQDSANGYHQYVNLYSFADFFILNELSKNVDGYRLSTFLYKDKESKEGKLTMGPVWDFDLAYRNADYCAGDNYTGWAYNFGNVCPDDSWQVPFWWNRMLEDSSFVTILNCRWQNLRMTTLDTVNLFNTIDNYVSILQQGQQRNFYQWPILGIYVWPNPAPIPITWQGEIESLKKWLRNRIEWLDMNMPGNCPNVQVQANSLKQISVSPNPADDYIHFNLPQNSAFYVNILNSNGNIVLQQKCMQSQISVSHLPTGIYMYILLEDNQMYSGKFIINR
jgi:subtilisin-like proprotein convertase family protein